MSLTIPLAHDFGCPWCWIATHQVERLHKQFDVTIQWLSYELWPRDLPRPPAVPRAPNPLQPPVPSRLELMLTLEHLELPEIERPKRMDTHNAHLAAQYAIAHGMGEPYILELYRAYWDRGESLEELEWLATVGERFNLDPQALAESVRAEQYADRIVSFDVEAYKSGIFHVPTFIIGDHRLAEQPYHKIEQAVVEATTK